MNTTLESLSFSNNPYFCENLEGLVGALKENKSLKILQLQNTGISEKLLPVLVDLITVNQTIENLDLSKNEIHESQALLLLRALSKNHSLIELNLSGNCFDESLDQEFRQMLDLNRQFKMDVAEISDENVTEEKRKKLVIEKERIIGQEIRPDSWVARVSGERQGSAICCVS